MASGEGSDYETDPAYTPRVIGSPGMSCESVALDLARLKERMGLCERALDRPMAPSFKLVSFEQDVTLWLGELEIWYIEHLRRNLGGEPARVFEELLAKACWCCLGKVFSDRQRQPETDG